MRFTFLLSTLLLAVTVRADLTLITKKHQDRADTFPQRPYSKDDISYGFFLDLFDGMGAWRLGATGLYDPETEGLDGIVTPEVGLLALDGIWEAGISLLKDYRIGEEDSDWGPLYYQFHAALNVPLGKRLMIGVGAYYPFRKFSKLSDFSTGDLDYAATLRLRF